MEPESRIQNLESLNKQLAIAEEFYRRIFDQALVGIAVLGHGSLIETNPAMERILEIPGSNRDQRKRFSQIVVPNQLPKLATNDPNAPFQLSEVETCVGSIRHCLWAKYPLAELGEGYEVVLLIDITERYTLRRQLVSSEKRALAGVLAASVGHEINNLMFPIVANLGLLEELFGTHPEAGEIIADAMEGVESLKRLTHNLSRVGRPTDDTKVPIDLDALARSVGDTLQRTGRVKHVNLMTRSAGRPAWIDASPGEIRQLILNLVFNSADACQNTGHIEVGVTVDAESRVRLWVSDTGCGISEEQLDDILDPYVSSKSGERGTGLGLTVVRYIVEQHQAQLQIESKVNMGTRVTVTFPGLAEE